MHFCVCLISVVSVHGETADIVPNSYKTSDNWLDKVLVALDTDCITHKSSKPEVSEIAESIVSSLGCVNFWFDNQTYKDTEDIVFFVANQTNTNTSTPYSYDEAYFYVESINETYTSLLDCLTDNPINWTDYCIVKTEFDVRIDMNSTFSINQDCTFQTVNDLTLEIFDGLEGVEDIPDEYLEYLDLLNIRDLDSTASLRGINDKFLYKEVTDDDPLVDVYIIDTGTRCNHQEFSDSTCESLHDDPDVGTFGIHGTGVASAAVGNTVGIARGFPLFWYNIRASEASLRVGVRTAINKINERGNRASVINFSLGTRPNTESRNEWDALFQVGVYPVVCMHDILVFFFLIENVF